MNHKTQIHFDEIADNYDSELPSYVVADLVKKKTSFIDEAVKTYNGSTDRVGLDVGCGTGNHIKAMEESGYAMFGMDFSQGMVELAKQKCKGTVVQSSITNPTDFQRKFDFIYAINVFHHLSDKAEQQRAMKIVPEC